MNDLPQWIPESSYDVAETLECGICTRCKKDVLCNGTVQIGDEKDDELCPIIAAAWRGQGEAVELRLHPTDGVICTQFEAMDGSEKPRCTRTMELPL